MGETGEVAKTLSMFVCIASVFSWETGQQHLCQAGSDRLREEAFPLACQGKKSIEFLLAAETKNVYVYMSMQCEQSATEKQDSGETRLLRLAMLGMIPGNGHPYSWSAIINGFDQEALESCPYPAIIDYLSRQEAVGITGARVTHVWTDDPADAPRVAALAAIPNVAAAPGDVLGEVDAVVIAVDDGDDHVERARPFVEAGLPVLIDKPLATNGADLRTFAAWHRAGAQILSSSGLRYASELSELEGFSWEWISAVTCNTWKRYGIHILEPVYCVAGPGFESVRSTLAGSNQIVELRHASGRLATLVVLPDAKAAFGKFQACGPSGQKIFAFADTYGAFRRQMLAFIDFAATGRRPFPFEETLELMVILLAAAASAAAGGNEIDLAGFRQSLDL